MLFAIFVVLLVRFAVEFAEVSVSFSAITASPIASKAFSDKMWFRSIVFPEAS